MTILQLGLRDDKKSLKTWYIFFQVDSKLIVRIVIYTVRMIKSQKFFENIFNIKLKF